MSAIEPFELFETRNEVRLIRSTKSYAQKARCAGRDTLNWSWTKFDLFYINSG